MRQKKTDVTVAVTTTSEQDSEKHTTPASILVAGVTANMPRNYTKAERALIYLGILSHQTRETINHWLAESQNKLGVEPRLMPESSYKMVRDRYLPALTCDIHDLKTLKPANIEAVWDQVVNPKCISDVLETK